MRSIERQRGSTFARSLTLAAPSGPAVVASAEAALSILSSTDWPQSGHRHREAVDAALKVLDGHRSTVDACDSLIAAADEAGVAIA